MWENLWENSEYLFILMKKFGAYIGRPVSAFKWLYRKNQAEGSSVFLHINNTVGLSAVYNEG